MKVRYHVLVTAAALPVVWNWSGKSVTVLGAFIVGGTLVDLDHLVDYVAHYGWRISARRMFRASYQGEYQRAYLPFHCWELWGIAAGAAFLTGRGWVWGLMAGWGLHLLLDQVFNRPRPLAYWLGYRWWKRFEYAELFPRQAQRRQSASGESDGEVPSDRRENPASARAEWMR